MRVLFDQGTPAPLRQGLPLHSVETAHERGWATLRNGDLLQIAENAGFDVMVTTDHNLQYRGERPVRTPNKALQLTRKLLFARSLSFPRS